MGINSLYLILILSLVILTNAVPQDQIDSVNLLKALYSQSWITNNGLVCSQIGIQCDMNNIISIKIDSPGTLPPSPTPTPTATIPTNTSSNATTTVTIPGSSLINTTVTFTTTTNVTETIGTQTLNTLLARDINLTVVNDTIIVGDLVLPYLKSLIITINSTTTTYNILQVISNLGALTTLQISNQNLLNFPASYSNLTSLQNVTITNCNLTAFPQVFSNFPHNLKTLDLSNNKITVLPTSYSSIIENLNMDNNLVNSIDDSLCSSTKVSFKNNALTSIGSCFACYWSSTTISWFTGNSNLTAPTTTCPNFVVDFTNQTVLSQLSIITITGTNLGWGVNTTTGLSVVIPNKKFAYKVPAVTSNGVNSLSLSFGSALTTTGVSWIYGNPVVNSVSYSQTSTEFELSISGSFYSNSSITYTLQINDVSYPMSVPNPGQITTSLLKTFQEGPTRIKVTSSLFGEVPFVFLFVRQFPKVTSTSIIGNKIHLYGSFSTANPIVSISGQNATSPTLISGTEMTVDLPQTLGAGSQLIEVDQDEYIFTSTSVLFIQKSPQTLKCELPCLNDAKCVNGTCQCALEWIGPQCNYKPIKPTTNPSEDPQEIEVELLSSKTSQGLFKFKDMSFDFKVYSIRELNIQDNIVREYVISKWLSDQPNENVIIYSNSNDNLNISVKIEISKDPRSYHFAEKSFNLAANSIKLSMNITGWEYQSSLNILQVVLQTNVKSQNGDGTSIQIGNSTESNIKYLSMTKKGIVFYGRFLEVAYSDGRLTYSSNKIIRKDETSIFIGISLPQCNECMLDPDFSVLVDPNYQGEGSSEESNSTKKAWILPVAVAVPVFAIAASIIAIVLIKKKFYIYRKGASIKFVSRASKSSFSLK